MLRNNFIALSIFGSLFIAACSTESDRDESGQVISEGSLDIFSLRVGDCTNDDEDSMSEETEILNDVLAVPCSEPHDNEFYAAFGIQDQVFPGDEAVTEYADQMCEEKFEPFVGIDYYDSVLEISYIYPTQQSWENNDREVVCFLYHMEFEKLQGTMRDAKI